MPGTQPVRTCIGCRSRGTTSELLRVVADGPRVIPDPQRRLPGRGAYIHREVGCLDLAQRRKAWARALAVRSPLDVAPVLAWLQAMRDEGPAGTR